MIIDLIIDRKEGQKYDPVLFAFAVNDYGDAFPELSRPILAAMSSHKEEAVKNALCAYIREGGYDPALCAYVNAVPWLPAWWDME